MKQIDDEASDFQKLFGNNPGWIEKNEFLPSFMSDVLTTPSGEESSEILDSVVHPPPPLPAPVEGAARPRPQTPSAYQLSGTSVHSKDPTTSDLAASFSLSVSPPSSPTQDTSPLTEQELWEILQEIRKREPPATSSHSDLPRSEIAETPSGPSLQHTSMYELGNQNEVVWADKFLYIAFGPSGTSFR